VHAYGQTWQSANGFCFQAIRNVSIVVANEESEGRINRLAAIAAAQNFLYS
jgi:hypothetical protein